MYDGRVSSRTEQYIFTCKVPESYGKVTGSKDWRWHIHERREPPRRKNMEQPTQLEPCDTNGFIVVNLNNLMP